jgi:hypothetical protein
MKRALAGLLSVAALGAATTATTAARADAKQECASAYEETQKLREKGQLTEAKQRAVRCSAASCSVYVVKDCTQWLAEIEASLPSVVFTAEDAGGADTAAARVAVDGRVVAERLDGKAVALDPGEHVVRFELVGAEAIEQRVLIRQGEKNRRIAASFKKAPAPPPPPPVTPVAVREPAAPLPPAPAPRAGGVPTWAWVTGGVGVVLLGVGIGFGVSALGAQSTLVEKCGGDPARCPSSTSADTVPLAERRDRNRNVFIGLGAVGVAAIAAGAVGIALAPPNQQKRAAGWVLGPLALPSGAGLAISGQL